MATISTIQDLEPEPSTEAGPRIHARASISARGVTALILRLRALVQEWVQSEVEEASVTGAEGIVTDDVINTFHEAGGDLGDAVPFALLEARRLFARQGDDGGGDGRLNGLRGLVCEVLARGVVARIEAPLALEGGPHHHSHSTEQSDGSVLSHSHVSLSKRFVHFNDDGETVKPTSALESAVDQNCTLFLAGKEAQRCAEELWRGRLVQHYATDGTVFFEPHPRGISFFDRLDTSRLAVPQYAYYANLAIHVAFIAIYTISTLEYTGLDAWEVTLWVFAAGYLVDDITRWFKIGGLDKVSFWVVIDLCTDVFFLIAFSFRVTGWLDLDHHRSAEMRLLAFQFLSCVAPFLWMQLLKLADGLQYFGVIQIVLLRMLQETAAFFLLLLITAIGFAQSLFALDAADGHRVENSASFIANLLVAGMLGQPDLDGPSDKFGAPFGTIIFYFYVFITVMLLANILVAFFASAYDKTVDAADDVFKAYFCAKVVSSIRAPDKFVYYVPFNLVEFFFIAPVEFFLPHSVYRRINAVFQWTFFSIPLVIFAVFESDWRRSRAGQLYLEMLADMPEERVQRMAGFANVTNTKDPDLSAAPPGTSGIAERKITKVAFSHLVGRLPASKGVQKEKDRQVLHELEALRSEIKALHDLLREKR